MTLTIEKIQAMPKVELHLHLDGSVLPQTLLELAAEQGAKLPAASAEELSRYMSAPESCQDLNEYLRTFDFVLPFLQTTSALERVAYELVEQCAADQVAYVEVRFAPQLHRLQGLTVLEIYEAVLRGLARGEQQFGVIARCIGICLRGHSEEQNLEVIEASGHVLHKGLVAVDLAGAEALYPPELYESVFALAQKLSLPITIHAGEAAGADSIATAVNRLGATRIGHGVRLKEDLHILQQVKEQGIPLEFCPISNLQTKAVAAWSLYPIIEYMEQGITVTVNTDNLTVSQTSLSKELYTLQQQCGLTTEGMIQLQRNAAAAIFLEEPAKSRFAARFEEKLEQWIRHLQQDA
ncbi:adenosine deaminase [Paenibacillus septentrionalis]|uniref:adenosine deaminase n=1 Tax=Paenibacillus septentrionalis TaxID=429342 RepID=A0ABW1UZE7_9BACL